MFIMEILEPNNQHIDSMESREGALEELLANPAGFAAKVKRALNSGNLNPAFVEEHLGKVIDEAERVNTINEQELRAQSNIEKETLKQNLLVKLANFEGAEKELSEILKSFCEDKNLELAPEINWTISGVKDSKLKADWISKDRKFALTISPDKVYVYRRVGSNWIGLPL